MSFESPTRIAPLPGLQLSITIKTRQEHLSRWGARIALFNAIIDDARTESNAPGAARTRNLRLRRPSLYPIELRARLNPEHNAIWPVGDSGDLLVMWSLISNSLNRQMIPWAVAISHILLETVRPPERVGRGNFHESDHRCD